MQFKALKHPPPPPHTRDCHVIGFGSLAAEEELLLIIMLYGFITAAVAESNNGRGHI